MTTETAPDRMSANNKVLSGEALPAASQPTNPSMRLTIRRQEVEQGRRVPSLQALRRCLRAPPAFLADGAQAGSNGRPQRPRCRGSPGRWSKPYLPPFAADHRMPSLSFRLGEHLSTIFLNGESFHFYPAVE